MNDVQSSIISVLSGLPWGHVVLVIAMVLGTLVVIGQALEVALPQAWKDKLDAIEHNSVVATILNFLRGFSYIHPSGWSATEAADTAAPVAAAPASDPAAKPPAPAPAEGPKA